MAKKTNLGIKKVVWKKPTIKLPGIDLDSLANHFWQHYDEIVKKANNKNKKTKI